MKLEVKRRKPRLEIVPMIDVLFFMLVFFLLFSTLKSARTGVDVELPKTLHIGAVRTNTVVISIDDQSRLFFGQRRIEMNELGGFIKSEVAKDARTQFVINPDATVPYEELVQIMDTLAGAGVDRPLWGVDRRRFPKETKQAVN